MLVLFLLANLAVSYGRAGVTIKNDNKLITMPDDFNLNRLSGLLSDIKDALFPHSDLNPYQDKKSVVVNAKNSNSETTRNNNNFPVDIIDDMDFGKIINFIKSESDNNANFNLNLINLELLVKLYKALLSGKISTTSTITVPTTTFTTTLTPSPVDQITFLKLELEKYLKYFVHSHHADNLKKMLGLHAEDGVEEKEKGESGGKIASARKTVFQTNKFNSKTKSELMPLSKPELPDLPASDFVNKLKTHKLGINIPVFRVKVHDRVLFEGKAEVKLFVDGLESASWTLVTFIVLLLIVIVLGCVFGVRYLQKIENMQCQDFENQQNQLKELKSRGGSSRCVYVRDCERHSPRLPPTCRCGYEDDITKSHIIADIIRGDFDRDSGTSSHMDGSSVV